jgi:Papain family cysteine protease
MKNKSFIHVMLMVLSFVIVANSQRKPPPRPAATPIAMPTPNPQSLGCSSQNATPSDRKTYLVGAGIRTTTDQRIINTFGKLVIPRGQTERAKQLAIDHDVYKETQIANLKSNFEFWKEQNPNATKKELSDINKYYKEALEYLTNNQEVKTRIEANRWDWRENGIDVGKTIPQGDSCNTCWAFVASDVAACSLQKSRLDLASQGSFPLLNNGVLTMSAGPTAITEPTGPFVQDLLNCMPIDKDAMCNYGWHGNAFDFMVYKKGIPITYFDGALIFDEKTEKDVVFQRNYVIGEKFACKPSKGFRKAVCWNYVSSPPDRVPTVIELKKALIEHGPIAAGIFFDDCFRDYKGGVFNEKNLRDINHVVLLIGWDDKKQAWLIKNSYGENWGEKGFAWIKYGSNNIGMFAAWMDVQPKKYSSFDYGN